MSQLIETRQATLERTTAETVEVRFKPGLVLDKSGLDEILVERERICSNTGKHAVLAIFPNDADFDLAVMTQDHYSGRKIVACTRFLAVAANSLMHERMASLYFAYFPQTFTTRIFVEEAEARTWLSAQLAERSLN